MGTDMVQVSILFCLEIGAETRDISRTSGNKTSVPGTEHCPAFLCRQGWTQGRRRGGRGGVGGGAPDRIRVCLSNSHLLAF